MKRILFASLVLLIALSAVGCNTPTTTPPVATSVPATDTAVPTVAPSDTPTTIPDLTLDQVKNAEYTISDGSQTWTFTLVDGTYKNGTDTAASDYYEAGLSDKVAFGDLNGDGLGDAAVLLGLNMGGSGVFEYLVAFVNQNGQPVEAGYYFIDDRAQLDSLTIASQHIVADAKVHAPNDPMCCPTLPVHASFELPFDGSMNLVQTSLSSTTPSGSTREITISSPEQGATVSNPCAISGGVTIAPFENNLVYKVYDEKMKELTSGPLMVNAPDMGAPGTFELSLDLSSTGYTGLIFVTISDLSAADGSTLAMNSIKLTLK